MQILSRTIEIEQIDIRVQAIIKPKHQSITLKDKYLVYEFCAKVQDYLNDGEVDGEERISDLKFIVLRQYITGVFKRYLSVDKATEVEIHSSSGNPIRIYFRNDQKADELMDAIISYKTDTQ